MLSLTSKVAVLFAQGFPDPRGHRGGQRHRAHRRRPVAEDLAEDHDPPERWRPDARSRCAVRRRATPPCRRSPPSQHDWRMAIDHADPVALAQALIRCRSVTPAGRRRADVARERAAAGRLHLPPPDHDRARHARRREPLCAPRHGAAAPLLCRPYRRGAGGRRGRVDAPAVRRRDRRTACSTAAARPT